jgi:hypothetical protein
MKSIELTDAEFGEVLDTLIVEHESMVEGMRHYPKGECDHESYATAAKLLNGVIRKMRRLKGGAS